MSDSFLFGVELRHFPISVAPSDPLPDSSTSFGLDSLRDGHAYLRATRRGAPLSYRQCFVYLSGASGDDPVYPNGFHDGSNYADEGFPSAAFNFPLRSRVSPKTNVHNVNSL